MLLVEGITRHILVPRPAGGFAVQKCFPAFLWAFTRNGLHVYYQVPGDTENRNGVVETDIEILGLLETGEQGTPVNAPATMLEIPSVRTLGGMRLRYRYIPPSLAGTELTRLEWRFGHRGRFCRRYGVTNTTADACTLVEANIPYVQEDSQGNLYDGNIYWEAVDANGDTDWSNWAGTQTTDTGIEASLYARYTIPSGVDGLRVPRDYRTNFRVKTREFHANPSNPMTGSDVAMLEAVMWNIGMSPSAKPGVYGVRLGVADRNRFVTSTPSVGRMVGRFNYISYGPVVYETQEMHTGPVTGEQPIAEIGRHWRHFILAHTHWQGSATINYANLEPNASGQTSAQAGNAIQAAEAVWDGVVNYPGGPSFANIPPTYTAARHSNIQTLTGSTFERHQILKAMAQMEANGRHQADYRIIVGGGDERGSKGFNQLLNTYTYGGSAQDGNGSAAEEVTGYTAAGVSAVNHYDARHNLIAKAVWLAIDDVPRQNGGGGGSFYRAFATTGGRSYRGIYQWPVATPLRKIETTAVSSVVTGTNHTDDDYELLAKGLGGYNQGAAIFGGGTGRSWINMLLDRVTPLDPSFITARGLSYLQRTAQQRQLFANTESMRYAMRVMHDVDKLNLPYRTYVWQGGLGVDVNGDGIIQDIPADPTATPPVAGVIETTEPWCFAYGENEWTNGTTWVHALDAAVGDPLAVPPIAPVGRIDCVTGVAIP